MLTDAPHILSLIDTHAHLNLEEFAPDLEALLERSRAGVFPPVRGRKVENVPSARASISALVCPGVDLETSQHALALAQKYDFIFAVVGVHPNHTAALKPGEWEELCRLVEELVESRDERLVGLGETGLDRHWDDSPFELQRKYFIETLQMAQKAKLPVVIHSRDANDDLDALLQEFYSGTKQDWNVGVVHSFSGTPEQAERWLELGFYLGFGGFVTYNGKSFSQIQEVAKTAPSDKILLETDCPFLTPHPLRGRIDRNEPLLCAFAARKLAELRGVSVADIARVTTENAQRLFQLPPSAVHSSEITLPEN